MVSLWPGRLAGDFCRSPGLTEISAVCFSCSGFSLRFGAGGHLDLAPGQSLCKALKILKIYSSRDAKSSWAKPSSQPLVNYTLEYFLIFYHHSVLLVD